MDATSQNDKSHGRPEYGLWNDGIGSPTWPKTLARLLGRAPRKQIVLLVAVIAAAFVGAKVFSTSDHISNARLIGGLATIAMILAAAPIDRVIDLYAQNTKEEQGIESQPRSNRQSPGPDGEPP